MSGTTRIPKAEITGPYDRAVLATFTDSAARPRSGTGSIPT